MQLKVYQGAEMLKWSVNSTSVTLSEKTHDLDTQHQHSHSTNVRISFEFCVNPLEVMTIQWFLRSIESDGRNSNTYLDFAI